MKLKYFPVLFLFLTYVFSSCVKDEIYQGPASVENVSILPTAPKSADNVIVTARVTDLKEVISVTLFYRTSSGGAFTPIAMSSGEQFLFNGTISAFPMGSKVEYYIEATNADGFRTVFPSDAPVQLASYIVGASNILKLYINEVFADGTKDATDPDWVEIYNGSDIAADISGYAFYDEGIKTSAKPKRILNAGTVIPSKGFLVLKTELTGGEYAVEFGLSTSGDAAYLDNTAGIPVASLDFLTTSLSGKKSFGRQPDGSSNLVIFTNPSRGTSNN